MLLGSAESFPDQFVQVALLPWSVMHRSLGPKIRRQDVLGVLVVGVAAWPNLGIEDMRGLDAGEGGCNLV